jgi:diguanylate cyclase (GGDEF)-like protein
MKAFFENMSRHDPLTGLHNRRAMEEKLEGVIKSLSRSGSALSLMMVDVDFFKAYNDVYGHLKGDDCLRVVADVIGASLFRTDDFAARYGGEEFVVVLPNTNERGAYKVAGRLLENMRARAIPHKKSSVAGYVTISIGATSSNAEYAQSANDYIDRADKALYKSKQNGRNRYTFKDIVFT